jgi:hypothetical protein
MEESYQNIRGGPLIIGGKEVKRSSKHKKKKSKRSRDERDEDRGAAASSSSSSTRRDQEDGNTSTPIVIETGSGRLSTSGTTVHGHEGSKFMTELKAGDAIIVTHPNTNVDESKTLTAAKPLIFIFHDIIYVLLYLFVFLRSLGLSLSLSSKNRENGSVQHIHGNFVSVFIRFDHNNTIPLRQSPRNQG